MTALNCSSVIDAASSADGAYLLYLMCVSPLSTCLFSLLPTESFAMGLEFSPSATKVEEDRGLLPKFSLLYVKLNDSWARSAKKRTY